MTAVEYLVSCITELEWDLLEKKIDCEEYGKIYRQNIEQAKEMERNQRGYTKEDVLKAGEIGEINHHDYKHIVKLLDEARQINETYGSKGSDELSKVSENTSFAKGSEKQYLSQTNTSQTEISDEEIEEAADKYSDAYDCPSKIKLCKHDIKAAFINSIGWYREQLKKK